jgi:hypothetical protein
MLAWSMMTSMILASSGSTGVLARSEAPLRQSKETLVQIGSHASFAPMRSSEQISEAQVLPSSEGFHNELRTASVIQARGQRSGGPKMSAYENNDCGGQFKASVMLPRDADLTGDHCIALEDAETGKPIGRLKVYCEGESGTAKFCIFGDPDDTSCQTTGPMCVNVAPENTPLVSGGSCVPAKEHPNEREAFWRFEDFPEETKWPECLVPPLANSTILLVVLGGVLIGIVINCMLWYGVFAPEEKSKTMPPQGKGCGGKPGFGTKGGKGKHDVPLLKGDGGKGDGKGEEGGY